MAADTLLTFPCDFPIKVVGRGDADFDALVIAIVQRHAPDLDLARVLGRNSRHGNWRAVTLVVRATSQAQLDALYGELSAHERVTMAL